MDRSPPRTCLLYTSIGVVLVDGRSSSLQFIDDNGRFLRGDEAAGGIAADLANHLLVIAHVQGIARLHSGQLPIEIAGPGQEMCIRDSS